jgi:mannose-6-phosphate isomerase-like protein (cupin superfamily)
MQKLFRIEKQGEVDKISLGEVNVNGFNDFDSSLNAIREKGILVAENERYTIHDLEVDELTVSLTELKKTQETRGHSHVECSEIYFFREGKGKMQVGNQMYYVVKGSIILVPRGLFHKVINLRAEDLVFVTVFEGKRFSKKYNFEKK